MVRLRNLIRSASARRSEQAFVIEGVRAIADAARLGGVLTDLFVDADALDRANAGTAGTLGGDGRGPQRIDALGELIEIAGGSTPGVRVVRPGVLAKLSDLATSQGVAAIFHVPDHDIEDLAEALAIGRSVIALDGIQDPANVGAVMRVAVAAGYKGLLVSEDSADPFGPKVARSSAGLLLSVPVVRASSFIDAVKHLSAAPGVTTVVADASGQPYDAADLGTPHVLVIGNEGRGPSAEVLAASDVVVAIPMESGVDSLNVATATAVIAFEAAAQRRRRP